MHRQLGAIISIIMIVIGAGGCAGCVIALSVNFEQLIILMREQRRPKSEWALRSPSQLFNWLRRLMQN